MADYAVPAASDEPTSSDEPTTGTWWAFGTILFAGSIMIMVGIFDFFQGLAAVVKSSFYVVAPNYAFQVDTTTWGWLHMLLGILMAVAGAFLFVGKLWARIVTVILALVSAVANFLSIPYYPVWSILIIALNILTLWAVIFHGRELQETMS